MMECMMGGGCPMGMMWLWWIFWIVLIALVVWLIIRAAKRPRNGAAKSPMASLQQRYAEGEITKEEYEERKRTLSE